MRQLRGYLILSLALATGALSLAAARSAPASVLPVACHAGALVAAIHSANANGAPTTLVLSADCPYALRAVDNHTKGPNGLPAITGVMTIVGNRAIVERSSDPATLLERVARNARGEPYREQPTERNLLRLLQLLDGHRQ